MCDGSKRFSLEVVVSSFGVDDYFMGFFFWLDLVATASLVFDLTVVAESLSGAPKCDQIDALHIEFRDISSPKNVSFRFSDVSEVEPCFRS